MGKQKLLYQNKTMLFVIGLLLVFSARVSAQENDSLRYQLNTDTAFHPKILCGADHEYMRTLALDASGAPAYGGAGFAAGGGSAGGAGATASFTPPSSFAASAIDTCGKFAVYYEDINSSTGVGFNDATYGADRRNTFCAVLSYIQSTFSFSLVSTTDLVKIYVNTSYDNAVGYYAPAGTTYYAKAGPQYFVTPNSIISGFVKDYVTTGTDPAPSGVYHCQLLVNFDKTYYCNTCYGMPIYYQNNYAATYGNCNIDLYTVLLHEMGHNLGWFSLVHFNPPTSYFCTPLAPVATLSGNEYTHLDYSIYGGTVFPSVSTNKLINGPVTAPTLTTSTSMYAPGNYWVNNNAAPLNHPVWTGSTFMCYGETYVPSYVSHLDDQQMSYADRQHVSPGDRQEYVMGPFAMEGVKRRTFTKGEIQSLSNIMGYSYIGGNPYIFGNHIPFSKKMAGYSTMASNYLNFTEAVSADFTMVNNGAPLTINLTSLYGTDLVDADGDPISVDPNSLVNFRGCGNGGNNHAQLSLSSGNQVITYTPRNNFYGRAQFGFKLFDGKEYGSYYVITIDVSQGSFPTYTAGTNMIVNANYEEGTEEKRLGTEETIQNSPEEEDGMHEGKWGGATFSDGHPYCFWSNGWGPYGAGIAVKNSWVYCSSATILKETVGSATSSFPTGGSFNYPASISGDRYQPFFYGSGFSYYYLVANAVHCHHYTLEFDVYGPGLTSSVSQGYKVGFADNSVAWLSPTFNYSFTQTMTINASWQHVSVPFWYCGTNPSNILYLQGLGGTTFLIDNLSLKDDLPAPSLSASIAQSAYPPCSTQLTTTVNNPACGVTYAWSGPGLSCTTCANPVASPSVTTTYTLTVTDGCGRHVTTTTTVSPGAISPITGSSTVCLGSTTTLHDATSGGTWTTSAWWIASVGSSTGIVYGNSLGSATITYTTTGGSCPGSTTFTITVVPLPTVSVTPPFQLLCSHPDTMTASSSGTGPFSYTWATSTGLSATTGSTVICSGIGSTTTYTVTVTDGNGCTNTATSTIVVPVCANLCDSLPGVTLLGYGGTIPAGTYSGYFYIDNPSYAVTLTGAVTFMNAVVAIAPNVTLNVDPNSFLNVTFSHLYCCSPTNMWQGIVLQSSASSSARMWIGKMSVLEDAQIGVYIPTPVTPISGNIFASDETIFNKNHWGVYVNSYGPTSPTTYPFSITNTAFTSRNLFTYVSGTSVLWPRAWPDVSYLKAAYSPGTQVRPPFNIDNPTGMPMGTPYSMSNCNDGITAYGGIVLIGVGPLSTSSAYQGITIGNDAYIAAQNMFDNMYVGIYAINSNLTSLNNVFMHMKTISSSFLGDGIYANKSTAITYKNQLQVMTTSTAGIGNKFYECRAGVECIAYTKVVGQNANFYSDHNISSPDPTNGEYGYYLTNFSKYDDVELNTNIMTNINRGISFNTTTDAYVGVANMNSNRMYGVVSDWTPGYCTMGIYANNMSTLSTTFMTGTVNANNNTIETAFNGISMSNFRRKVASSNTNAIQLRANTITIGAQQAGVYHYNNGYNQIIRNYVLGSGFTPVNESGVQAESNQSATVTCNNVIRINKGFYFKGNPNISQWNHNIMQSNRYGYYLLGRIGNQGSTASPSDNWWQGSWTGGNYMTFTNNPSFLYSFPLNSQLFVRPSVTGFDPNSNWATPTPWYNIYGTCLTCNSSSGWGLNAASTATPYSECAPLQVSWLKAALVQDATLNYVTLSARDSVYLQDSTMDGNPPKNVASLNWIAQMAAYQSMLGDSTLPDSSDVLNVFNRFAQQSRYAWLSSIEDNLSQGNYEQAAALLKTDIDELTNTSTDRQTGVVMADAKEADAVVQNYITYYQLYLKYMTDSLNPDDSAQVKQLAHLCPLTDGWIVYQARSFYTLLYGDLGAWDNACGDQESEEEGKAIRSAIASDAGQSYRLFPNPSNGNISVVQTTPDIQPVKAEVWSSTGISLYKTNLQFAQKSAHLHVEQLKPGLYMLHLTDNKGRVFNLKFVIE